MKEFKKDDFKIVNYKSTGFGKTFYFVDIYHYRLEYSILTDGLLADEELEKILNIFIDGYEYYNATFFDDLKEKLPPIFKTHQKLFDELETTIYLRMGKEKFLKNYKTKHYYLMYYRTDEPLLESQETFSISNQYPPLRCLKMAHQLAKQNDSKYRILLSDHQTEVDPELLQFAISEE